VIRAPTRILNPSIPKSEIDAAMQADPEAARAEWLAEFRDDIADFIDRRAIMACVDADVRERRPTLQHRYTGFVDVSGGRSDSMVLAVSHVEGDTTVLDCIREAKPPFNPEAVTEEFSDLLRSYRLAAVWGDRYAAEWVQTQFRKCGIHYREADKSKSEIYVGVLPALNSGAVSLLDNDRLIDQFCALERRVVRGGRRVDVIDHPPAGHDDVANAAAGALLFASRRPERPTTGHLPKAILANEHLKRPDHHLSKRDQARVHRIPDFSEQGR